MCAEWMYFNTCTGTPHVGVYIAQHIRFHGLNEGLHVSRIKIYIITCTGASPVDVYVAQHM